MIINTKTGMAIGKLRTSRRLFYTTRYDWGRVSVKRTKWTEWE